MRRQLVSLAFAGLAGLASLGVAPVGSDRTPSSADGTVAVQHATLKYPAIRDEAAMIIVGTFLIGLAAALRRAA